MSWPEDKTAPRPPAGPTARPPRLAFLTVPLLVAVIVNAVELLLLPFQGAQTVLASYELASQVLGEAVPTPGEAQVQATIWMMFVLTAVLILWFYYTRRAVLDGRSWGRVSSIVIGVLSLLFFPFGTVLGIVMLIGAFDRAVVAYTSRR